MQAHKLVLSMLGPTNQHIYFCLLLLTVLAASYSQAFIFTSKRSHSSSINQYDQYYEDSNDDSLYDLDDDFTEDEEEEEEPEDFITAVKRYYRGWGHRTRFPWKRLPNRMCFRQKCKYNKDCCRRYNLCDKSAKICIDCWYAKPCKSERDCCSKYPYCARTWRQAPNNGYRYIAGGKCVRKL